MNALNYTLEGKRIAFTDEDRKKLSKQTPQSPPNSRLLQVAIIGSPNAGKSTLANRMLGWRFSAVSSKVNTTRSKTRGVLTQDEVQIVFLDTPGMVNPSWMKWKDMERTLLTDPHASLYEADVIAVVLDVEPVWSRRHLNEDIVNALALHRDKRSILILNKVDRLKSKISLFDIVTNLTGGVIGGHERKRTELVSNRKLDPDSLFRKMEKLHHAKLKVSDEKADAIANQKQLTNNQSALDVVDRKKDIETRSLRSMDNSDGTCVEDEEHITVEIKEYGEDGQLVDFSKERVWSQYQQRLMTASASVDDPNRWKEFEEVFIVSAKTGSGVEDVVDWMTKAASPSPWQYHGDVVTDQEPLSIARMAVWEKMLNLLPREIPYLIKIVLEHWFIDETGQLRIHFNLYCSSKDAQSKLLGREGGTIQAIQREARQDLMDTFKTDLFLELTAKLHKGPGGTSRSKNKVKTKKVKVQPTDCEVLKTDPKDCEVFAEAKEEP